MLTAQTCLHLCVFRLTPVTAQPMASRNYYIHKIAWFFTEANKHKSIITKLWNICWFV